MLEFEEELTDEGKQMLKNLAYYLSIDSPPPVPPEKKKTKIKIDPRDIEIQRLRMQITKMIVNSQLVVADCDKILANVMTKEEYIKSDAKVARFIHMNNAQRLHNILDGLDAFDK